MKFIKTILFLLLPFGLFAQGFPTYNTRNAYNSLADMVDLEGYTFSYTPAKLTVSVSGTVITGQRAENGIAGYVTFNTDINAASFNRGSTPTGRARKILGGKIVTNVGCQGYYYTNQPNGTSRLAPSYGGSLWGTPMGGGEAIIEPTGMIRDQQYMVQAFISSVTLPYSGTATPVAGTTQSLTIVGQNGLRVLECTDDLNYGAPYVIEWIGDSKAYGVGTTEKNNQVAFLSRNYYADKGYDVRLRNMSVSSSTVQQHEYSQKEGRYKFPVKAVLGIIDLGTNNSATTPDTVANTVARIALRWIKGNPKGICVVQALMPRNDGNEAASATISTATGTKIASLANPRILFCPAARTAFTATDATKYSDNLHPNDAGNLLWWEALKGWLAINVPILPNPY